MKTLILVVVLITSSVSIAQDLADRAQGQTFLQSQMQQGRLVTVTLTLGNPLKLFVTGKEEARLSLSNLKLKIRRLDPYLGEELAVQRDGRYYTVIVPKNQESLKQLEVIATVKDESESFQFKIDQQKP